MARKKKKQEGYSLTQVLTITGIVGAIIIGTIILASTNKTPITTTGQQIVLATVNGEEITSIDVQNVQQQIMLQTGQPMPEEQALDHAITMNLLLREAERRGYATSTEEAEMVFEIEGIPIEMVRAEIESEGITYEQFIKEQAEQITLMQLLNELESNVVVTEEEARQLYDEQVAPTGEATYEEISEGIKEFLKQQKATQELQMLAARLYEEASITYH